jgi:hypothetical protein
LLRKIKIKENKLSERKNIIWLYGTKFDHNGDWSAYELVRAVFLKDTPSPAISSSFHTPLYTGCPFRS